MKPYFVSDFISMVTKCNLSITFRHSSSAFYRRNNYSIIREYGLSVILKRIRSIL